MPKCVRQLFTKSNKITMNKFKILSVAFFASASVLQAQDINEAEKQIDAEQFQKAKTSLKSAFLVFVLPCS